MSKMAELELDILDMLDEGRSPQYISTVLEVPVTWVYEASKNNSEMNTEVFNPYGTVNS